MSSKTKNVIFRVFTLLLPLPLLAFAYCLSAIYILRLNFEYHGAEVTHCHVANFGISVSEAISNPDFSRHLWQAAVVLHAPSRVYFSKQLSHLYTEIQLSRSNRRRIQFYLGWIYLTKFVSHLELLSLLALSFLTSQGIFIIHQVAVTVFLVSMLIHMALACSLEVFGKKSTLCSKLASAAITARQALAGLSLLAALGLTYFFQRHNRFCEAYIYSYFCISEYVTVLLNMIFQLTSPLLLLRTDEQKVKDINDNSTKSKSVVV